jgi:hypothetical protein
MIAVTPLVTASVLLVLPGVLAAATRPQAQTKTKTKTLAQAVAERPFAEYQRFWPMGEDFVRLMSRSILSEWRELEGNPGSLDPVLAYFNEYMKTVYGRDARKGVVDEIVTGRLSAPLQSGEFDALSYSFFRSAFEILSRQRSGGSLEEERRRFTRRVGKRFFGEVRSLLRVDLPRGLDDAGSLASAGEAIDKVGAFLKDQGYFRDHFAFRFDVDLQQRGKRIQQTRSSVPERLKGGGVAYALFEMGYPVILPSAVYLFNTVGEAQHHSSRTIEELFAALGYEASETRDFDPSGFPSDRVVELWEIRKRTGTN